MPFDRDQVIAAVSDYYDFLTRLHVDPEDIRRPPPEGWEQISQQRLSQLGLTDTVIDLLKHLPYVQNDENFDPILVWQLSGCCDYTGLGFQSAIDDRTVDQWTYFPGEIEREDCTWEKLLKSHPHIIPLASPSTKYGDYIFCDTHDGEFVIWDFWGTGYTSFLDAKACFSHLKQAFFDLKFFPIGKTEIRKLTRKGPPAQEGLKRLYRENDEEFQRLAWEHGWPSSDFQWRNFMASAATNLHERDNIHLQKDE